MKRLEGKVALVTGAGGGIGKGIVARYVQEGANVVAVDVVGQGIDELKKQYGAAVLPLTADVSSWQDNCKAVQAAIDNFGRLDVFIGNAGIYDHGASLESLGGEQLSLAFDELMSVNVKGYILGVRAALDALLETRGAVILTASYASFSPSGGGVLYTAAKHAVAGLVRQLAYELAPDIRVNGIAPGVAPTSLKGIGSLAQGSRESILEGTASILPLPEIPDAGVYGALYAFLASHEEAGHITGSIFNADNGLAIRGLARARGRG